MKNWPAGFITELQKKTGLEPCLILRTTIDGTVYHISDHVITFPAGALGGFANVSTKAWVATWGQIHEQISGNIGEILIADMSLALLVDQADANNIRHLALQHELEKNPTELYLWLPSLNATLIPPQLVTKGHIEDIDLPDETQVNITIEDETSRMQDYLGTKITSEAYPLCDPDVVGKMIPIVIGTVPKLPALCVDSGWISTITGGIDYATTSITVAELPVYSVVNKSITIDEEQILITAAVGKVLTIIRGQNSTIPQVHTKNSKVIEKKATPLIYLVADHPVTSIGTILARVQGVHVDITGDCVKHIAGTSNYLNKALITIPDFVKVANKIQIAVNDALTISDGFHSHTTGATSNLTPYNDGIAQALPINGNIANSLGYAAVTNINANLYSVCVAKFNDGSTINSSIINISCTCNISLWQVYVSDSPNIWAIGAKVVKIFDNLVSRVPFSKYSSITNFKATLTGASDMQLRYVHLAYNFKDPNMPFGYNYPITGSISVLSRSITSTTGGVGTTGSASLVGRSGTITLSGNSVADIMVGDAILVDVTVANNTPAETFSRLLSTYCADTSLVQIGTLPDFYKFNGAITEYKKKVEWFDLLAFQARCWYRKIAGVSRLIVRSATPASPTIINACALTSEGIKDLRYKKAPKTDVINVINILYNRDWTSSSSNAEAYQSTKTSTDDVSITNYGRIEQPNMFMFDFITSDAMASDVGSFYQDFYAVRKWLISFRTYLDRAALEFGDDVQLPFANDLTGVIVEAGLNLGAGEQMPGIEFTIATTHIPVEVANGIHTLLGIQIHTKNREAITYV